MYFSATPIAKKSLLQSWICRGNEVLDIPNSTLPAQPPVMLVKQQVVDNKLQDHQWLAKETRQRSWRAGLAPGCSAGAALPAPGCRAEPGQFAACLAPVLHPPGLCSPLLAVVWGLWGGRGTTGRLWEGLGPFPVAIRRMVAGVWCRWHQVLHHSCELCGWQQCSERNQIYHTDAAESPFLTLSLPLSSVFALLRPEISKPGGSVKFLPC